MIIADWWIETFSGKVDTNPIFSGLSLRERRNPRKCKVYIFRRVTEASCSPPSGLHETDVSGLKLRIYESGYIRGGVHDAREERKIIEAAFADVLAKGPAQEPDWSGAVAQLKDEPGVGHYFPSLFTGDIRVMWADYANEAAAKREKAASEARARAARQAMAAKEKAEAQAEQERQNRIRRAQTQQKITELKAEVSRLNAMYYAETEFTEKARLMYAVEAREDAIRHLEARL